MASTKPGAVQLEKFSHTAIGNATRGSNFHSHHVFQDAAMKAYVGTTYRKALGLAIPLFGGNARGGAKKNTSHYFANQAQKGGLKRNPTHVAYKALVAAGCRKRDATEIVQMFETAYKLEGWL